jgi:hypothetical protein
MMSSVLKDVSGSPQDMQRLSDATAAELRPSEMVDHLTASTKDIAQHAEDGAMPNSAKSLSDNKTFWDNLTPGTAMHMAKVGGKAAAMVPLAYALNSAPGLKLLPDWMKTSILVTAAAGLGYSEVGAMKNPEAQRAAMLVGKGLESTVNVGTRAAQSAVAPTVDQVTASEPEGPSQP